ncbi:MAG: DUF2868 domain-containing protein, partial [Verrucomicrobiota bacterium]
MPDLNRKGMKLREARTLLAVQAIEQCDGKNRVFSEKDRRECSAMAGAPLPKNPERSREDRFLIERADLLLARAEARSPQSLQWAREDDSKRRFGLILGGGVLVAAVLGFLTNELGPDKRINILSFPLLGILAWNLVVLVRELWLLVRSRKQIADGDWANRWGAFFSPSRGSDPGEGESEEEGVILAGKRLFRDRWQTILAPMNFARLKSALHVAALVFALAAIGGMYVRGLANEYRAVWESTFFKDGEAIRPFLNVVLGPAATLTGATLPDAESLDTIRWAAGEGEVAGENAARWIHWYAVTIALFVLLPRGIFATIWSVRSRWSTKRLPVREVNPGWFEHLLQLSSGAALELVILPYGHSRERVGERELEGFLEDEFERAVELEWLSEVSFGEEDAISVEAEGKKLLPLMNFSATPEKETHLLLLQTLLNQLSDPVESLLLDASAFAAKSSGLPDAAKRREDRL